MLANAEAWAMPMFATLAFTGILDIYFTMNDRQAQWAMNSLSFNSENRTVVGQSGVHTSEKPSQVAHL